MIEQEIIRNTITVTTLLLKYFLVGWALIIISLFIVKYITASTSSNRPHRPQTQRNHITAEQKYYKEVA